MARFEIDSAGDGIADHLELLLYGTSPFLRDSDGDGRDDGSEITGGTDPNDQESDGDGTPDGDDPTTEVIPAWHIVTRGLDYHFTAITDGEETIASGTLDLDKSWPSTLSENTQVSSARDASALNGNLASFAPIPQAPPETGFTIVPGDGGFTAGADATETSATETGATTGTSDANADQCAGWLVLPKPAPLTLT